MKDKSAEGSLTSKQEYIKKWDTGKLLKDITKNFQLAYVVHIYIKS